MLWLHATTIGAAGQDPSFLLETYERSANYEKAGECKILCICAGVMDGQKDAIVIHC